MAWLGSDATAQVCAAADHTDKAFTVSTKSEILRPLSSLTGLPSWGYELISITEFLSLICYVVGRPNYLRGLLARYVGDCQNSATWVGLRRPGDRVDKYLVRILNRSGNDIEYANAPMYIPTNHGKLPGDLSRLSRAGAIKCGEPRGYQYSDAVEVGRLYFCERLKSFSIISPSDNADRARSIMQFAGKLIARQIPQELMGKIQVILLGGWANGRIHVMQNDRIGACGWGVILWPPDAQRLLGNAGVMLAMAPIVGERYLRCRRHHTAPARRLRFHAGIVESCEPCSCGD